MDSSPDLGNGGSSPSQPYPTDDPAGRKDVPTICLEQKIHAEVKVDGFHLTSEYHLKTEVKETNLPFQIPAQESIPPRKSSLENEEGDEFIRILSNLIASSNRQREGFGFQQKAVALDTNCL